MIAVTDTDRAWAAGIIEGEGSIRINSFTRQNWGALIVSVTSTDLEMVEWFPPRFAGKVKTTSTRVECKPAWRWVIASRQAAAFLREIEPYCRIPRIQAKLDLAFEFQAQKATSHRDHGPEYRAEQIRFFERMKALNVRGVAS